MDAKAFRLFIVVGAAALLIGCATAPPSRPHQPTPAPASRPAARPKPMPPAATHRTAPPAAQTKKQPTKPASKQLIQKGQILVTKEEYRKTFDDVHHLIEELNTIIANRDYQQWTHYLTPRYLATYSSPRRLAELSNQPLLKKYNLHLKTLKDYFLDVVVPSRANAHLDDVDFVSKTQVKAITVIDGQRYILYDLRLEDGGWKVGVS